MESRGWRSIYDEVGYVRAGSIEDLLPSVRLTYDRLFAAGEPFDEFNTNGTLANRKFVIKGDDHAALAATGLTERANRLVEQFVGENVFELLPLLLHKPAGASPTEWHTHAEAPRPSRVIDSCTLWIPLDDAAPESGALRFVPTNARGIGYRRDEDDVRLVPPDEVENCHFAAGSVVAINDWVLHGAGPNLGAEPRRAVAFYAILSAL